MKKLDSSLIVASLSPRMHTEDLRSGSPKDIFKNKLITSKVGADRDKGQRHSIDFSGPAGEVPILREPLKRGITGTGRNLKSSLDFIHQWEFKAKQQIDRMLDQRKKIKRFNRIS